MPTFKKSKNVQGNFTNADLNNAVKDVLNWFKCPMLIYNLVTNYIVVVNSYILQTCLLLKKVKMLKVILQMLISIML